MPLKGKCIFTGGIILMGAFASFAIRLYAGDIAMGYCGTVPGFGVWMIVASVIGYTRQLLWTNIL
jgi:hypothetical protein